MTIELAKLQRHDPRSVWANEARDFTPWLAEHLEELSAVLGMDLELVRAESDCGDFSIDILARDLGRDVNVVIENQLEQTDHSHLGQAITYAAGVEAGAVVWISRQFREEHRQAIDWLNHGLGNATQFFGVVVEVLRIGDSKPAASFRLIAQPAGHNPANRGGGPQRETTERGERYQAYFQRLVDVLRQQHRFTNASTASPVNWVSFTTGVAGFQYAASFNRGGRMSVELYIDRRDENWNLAALEALRAKQAEIQRAFGGQLDWQPLSEKRACRIAYSRAGTIMDSEDALEEYHEWMMTHLLKLKSAMGPFLAEAASAAESASTPLT